MKIDKPGIYRLTEEQYDGDCCPGPSMRAGLAVTLMAECPAKAWQASYLNPAREREEAANLDFGLATHVAILEPDRWGDAVAIVQANDWRTNDAKAQRDRARNQGRIPILAHVAEKVVAISAAVRRHGAAAELLRGGEAERSLIWHDAENGVWCKSRVDYRIQGGPDGTILVNYKTAPSAHPREFEKHAYQMGYHQQAAWECEAEERVTGRPPARHLWIVQEREPPYLVAVCEADMHALGWGHTLNLRARAVWGTCLKSGEWPGYRLIAQPNVDAAFKVGLPKYAGFALEERREIPTLLTDLPRPSAGAMQAPLERPVA